MSEFGRQLNEGMRGLLDYLGDPATYTKIDGTTKPVRVLFNEYVGAVDNQGRASFSVSTEPTDPYSVPDPVEGDFFIFETVTWVVVDVRDSEDGTAEIRCDRSKLVND